MASMPRSSFVLGLGFVVAGVLTGCGGGGSSTPTAQPTSVPLSAAIVSGGQFVVSGTKGITFTFAVGAGVPAGETALVSILPPPPCVGTGCTAVQPPVDGFVLSVAPQPLAVSALPSVALAGVQSPFGISFSLYDTGDLGSYTTFADMRQSGGAIAIIDPASARPVHTLVPGHVYQVAIYSTGRPPP